MRLGNRKNNAEDAQVDMTSMLDIVFIMLIFFIVTSSFVNESGVEVNRPQASHSVSQKDASILIAVTADNDIYIDKRVVDKERVQATLEHILTEQSNTSVVIQADEFAFNGTVVSVMDSAKGAGIKSIALATEQK
ncbi:biopolymer transporter ExbD [Vibrio sp. JC009]|uniref:ExbD/TolR family protein n=1 Tax=Vibrio sp. JC009 TaxID=2912314 RepID=UPI0023AF4DD8|nr:biopolymer transporter ExbD [Vibrio sp. JC009]WED23343.1 biopolymer transporter ExbD [Vibrio sp. JC009]